MPRLRQQTSSHPSWQSACSSSLAKRHSKQQRQLALLPLLRPPCSLAATAAAPRLEQRTARRDTSPAAAAASNPHQGMDPALLTSHTRSSLVSR
jgi:hypothetical protein